jgi:hypothetical protein
MLPNTDYLNMEARRLRNTSFDVGHVGEMHSSINSSELDGREAHSTLALGSCYLNVCTRMHVCSSKIREAEKNDVSLDSFYALLPPHGPPKTNPDLVVPAHECRNDF